MLRRLGITEYNFFPQNNCIYSYYVLFQDLANRVSANRDCPWKLSWPWKNVGVEEWRCSPFSEHLVLSWCYPPHRVSTASDSAACGAGSVTDPIDVVAACALDCWRPFAVGLQLLSCMFSWFVHFGVLDKVCLNIHGYAYGYGDILLYCQKHHYNCLREFGLH